MPGDGEQASPLVRDKVSPNASEANQRDKASPSFEERDKASPSFEESRDKASPSFEEPRDKVLPDFGGQESHQECEDSGDEDAEVANARYVVKLSRKRKYARLHLRGGCHYAEDHRKGFFFEDLEDACYDGYCRKCFPTKGRTRPILDSQHAHQVLDYASASSSESSSSEEEK